MLALVYFFIFPLVIIQPIFLKQMGNRWEGPQPLFNRLYFLEQFQIHSTINEKVEFPYPRLHGLLCCKHPPPEW